MSQVKRVVSVATSLIVIRRALKVSAVVGSTLNLINQSGALFGDASIDWARLCLNFLVPYSVATYSAVGALLETADAPPSQLPSELERREAA